MALSTQPPPSKEAAQNGPHRVIASALMKRAMADIPLVTHIQKESAGMNKLYAQSMCSVSQWRSYQAAEATVSAEVDEVRAEADEIEPGWSQVRRKFSNQDNCFVLTRPPLISVVFVLFYYSISGDRRCSITT